MSKVPVLRFNRFTRCRNLHNRVYLRHCGPTPCRLKLELLSLAKTPNGQFGVLSWSLSAEAKYPQVV